MQARVTRQVTRRSFTVANAAVLSSIAVVRRLRRGRHNFSWKCGNSIGPKHPLNVRLDEAFAKIRTETNGAFEITNFPANALGGFGAMASQLRLGPAEMMAGTGDAFGIRWFRSRRSTPCLLLSRTTRPRIAPSVEAWVRWSARSFWRKDSSCSNAFRIPGFARSRPARSRSSNVEDLQGVKLRVTPSRFRFDIFRSLGCSPAATVDVSATCTALRTHVVDGAENPLSGIEGFSFLRGPEVLQHVQSHVGRVHHHSE